LIRIKSAHLTHEREDQSRVMIAIIHRKSS